MLVYYSIQDSVNEKFNEDKYFHIFIRMIPSITYSLIVIPMNMIYKIVAIKLTSWGI